MLETLKQIDQALTISINHFHSPLVDQLMIAISDKLTWIPLYLGLLLLLSRTFDRRYALYIILAIIVNIVFTDQVSVFFKESIMRYRPCHNLDLMNILHLPDGCGGKHGFISSHAANTFGLAVLVSSVFKRKWITWVMVIYAVLNSYSRIYLGKHFVADIIGGAALGILFGYVIYRLLDYLYTRYNPTKE